MITPKSARGRERSQPSILLKDALTRVGEACSPERIKMLDTLVNYLEIGSWLRRHGVQSPIRQRVRTRDDVFLAMAERCCTGNQLYLEFGVYLGESLRRWTSLLPSPSARFVGFDSFRGIPEDWIDGVPAGTFSTEGKAPNIADPRVSFEVGWFEDTVPTFSLPAHDQLIIVMDADLYSSTRLVLDCLRHAVAPGTLLYFDEFHARFHERQAFHELISEEAMSFQLIAATHCLISVAFQRIG